MSCNGIHLKFFVAVVFLMFVFIEFSLCQQANKVDTKDDTELGFNGGLYDVFKKRLDEIVKELSYDIDSNQKQMTEVTYTNDQKKRSIDNSNNCLYEEFKRRLDTFNNEFILNPKRDFKRLNNGAMTDGNVENVENAEKLSANRDSLYEDYKKRLAKINDKLYLDNNKNTYDRDSRGGQAIESAKTDDLQAKQLSQNVKVFDRSKTEDSHAKLLQPKTNEQVEKSDIGIKNTTPDDEGERSDRDEKIKNFSNIESATKEKDNEYNGGNFIHREHVVDENSLKTQDYKEVYQNSQTANKDNSNSDLKSFSNSDTYDSAINVDDDSHTHEIKDNMLSLARIKENERKINNYAKLVKILRRNNSGKKRSLTYGGDPLSYGIDIGTSYPAVLTKALESSLNPSSSMPPKGLLETVASKMNMSTLELAKHITNTHAPEPVPVKADPKLSEVLQKFVESTVNGKLAKEIVPPEPAPIPAPAAVQEHTLYESIPAGIQAPAQCAGPTNSNSEGEASAHISSVLDKVLYKLERIQQDKEKTKESENGADNCQPEGAPCDLIGSWNSHLLGLRFDISVGKSSDRHLAPAEKNNKLLSIDVAECVPPKVHDQLDTSWKFMGSALKQLGGPFYMYSQNRGDNVVATFIGSCRTCSGIDTIFGSWAFHCSSKDCQDISTSIQNKRDILRRYNMDAKRQQRYKDLLFQSSKFSKCNDKDDN